LLAHVVVRIEAEPSFKIIGTFPYKFFLVTDLWRAIVSSKP